LLFSKIDTLLLLHISGGEPFTYPYLDELINYVAQNFGSKLGRLEMTTNGTIIPSEKLLACIRDFGLHLIIDDYREALQQYRDKHNYLLSKLNEYSISYQILKADFWVDLAPFDTDHSGLSEEQLRRHFEICSVPWQEYRNGKLYLCNYAAYAEIAGIVEKLPSNDYMDLNKINDGNKAELLEFRLGYSENGYTEFCKRCSGYHNNPYKVSAAEQI